MKKRMAKVFLNVLLVIGIWFTSEAQDKTRIHGIVRDSAGLPIMGAQVKVVFRKDSIQLSTGHDGAFIFKNIVPQSFSLSVTMLGYASYKGSFNVETGATNKDLGVLTLASSSTMLDEVKVQSKPRVTIKEDTIEYRVDDLRLREGAVAEDALKKLDGITVDKDGNVTAQGESVTRVRVNGKDFFGGDVKTATQNLPANIIDKIQIIDDYGDVANLTGNKTGEAERIMNIELAPGTNKGSFGNLKAGGGTDKRYQASGMYRRMDEGQSISLLGSMNNVNAQPFDFNIRGGGARRMPGGGGFGSGSRMGGGFGGPGGFGGGSDGLTNTRSLGMDYRNDFSKKLTMYGNYSYSHNTNKTLSNSLTKGTYPDSVTLQNSNSTGNTGSNNHRFDWNIEWKPDSSNYVKIAPTLSIGTSDGATNELVNESLNSVLINDRRSNNFDHSNKPNYGISGLFNHLIGRKGRNVFVNFSLNSTATKQDQERITHTALSDGENADSTYRRQLTDLDNKGLNGGISASYTEPVGKNGGFDLNYDYNFSHYDNDREGYVSYLAGEKAVSDASLDNIYTYSFMTHRFGANYHYRDKNIVYSIGAAVQPSVLSGSTTLDGSKQQFRRTAFNFVPVARFEYKFSRSRSFNINYNGSSNEPSFSQLQPITDASNPNAPVTGNPDLSAAFTHNLRLGYNNFAPESGDVIFTSLDVSLVQDKIVTNRISTVDDSLGIVQSTYYLNTSGNYTIRGFYNYSKPFDDRKYTLSFNGSANYGNNVSYTNAIKNLAKNWVLSQGVNLRFNPKETLEVNPGVTYTYNTTANSLESARKNVVSTWAYSLNGSVNLTPTVILGADFTKTTNSGYQGNVGANPMIINSYVEKQFLKGNKGSLRFSGNDLLNQQTSVSRTVTSNEIRDNRSNRLARYFMLTFSYRFQNFSGRRQMGDDWGPRRGDMPPPGDMNRGGFGGQGG